jgi:hypothetical protein
MIANQIAGLLTGGVVAPLTDYESIQTVTLGSSASTISFTSIPGTYKHLQIRAFARYTTGTETGVKMRINSDTGSNYAYHELYGTGTGAGAANGINQTAISDVIYINSTASVYGAAVVDILDYADTNKFKTIRSLNGADVNGGGYITFMSGLWRSTSAITNIEMYVAANAMAQYSSFALYGIK